MKALVATLNRDLLPLLLTLTYPGEWSIDPEKWKRDLDAFGKAVRRCYPGASFIWKLEPQTRGAPHYHCLLYGVDFMHMDWLAQTWYRIVGGTQEAHLKAGTRVERARESHAAAAYAAKSYLVKAAKLPPGWENVGRWWGVIGRADLPVSHVATAVILRPELVKLRRLARRRVGRFGRQRSTPQGFTLFVGNPRQWARAVLWAAGEAPPPVLPG